MQRITFIILFIITTNNFGQNFEIVELINQIAKTEVPANFKYYFIVPKSLEQPKIYDSIQNYQIRELRMSDKDFPVNLIYESKEEIIDWKKYDLKNAKYVLNEYNYPTTSPPTGKNVLFVKYNIGQKKYDSLVENRKPQTLIVKKKWCWNKKNIWKNKKFHKELLKAWKIDKEKNLEETVYFQFSKPIFSADKQYAKVSLFKNRRCNGSGFTALYRNVNGIWRKLIEYNKEALIVSMTHSNCEDVSISIPYRE